MGNKAMESQCRPRLLFVENSLHITGAFVAALEMEDTLCKNYDIEFVLPSKSTLRSAVEANEIVCHSLPMSELGRSWRRLLLYVPVLMLNTVRLRRLLSRRNIDVLIVNDYYNLLGVMVKLIGWRGCLLTIVRLMPQNQHRVLNRVWTELAVRFSHKVLAVSRAVASQLPSDERVVVIYDPDGYQEEHPKCMGERGDGEIRCLYLSNYIAGKGHLHGLHAFAAAYRQNPQLRLRFVGGDMGLDKNRELRKSLELATAKMGLDQVVTFDGYSDDVELEIKNADIVLNFSESESFSHTCLEASTFGAPVIATRCGGPEEIIDDGVSGLLVSIGDVDSMSAAILKLSRDAVLRHAMGNAGRTIVRERFSKDRFVEAFESLFAG